MGLLSFINLRKRKRIILLVVDLDKIIKGAGKQKTSTIHLNIFPTEANEISSIFMEFTDNMHKQMWLIGKDIPTFESLEAKGAEITSLTFNASGMGVTWDEMPKFLSTRGFYLYAKVKGLDVDVPIDKVTKVIVSKPVYGEVRVKEQCFFLRIRWCMRKTNDQSKNHQQGKELFMDFYFRLKQLLSGVSPSQMCRQPTADLLRRKFVIFSCHTQSMPAKNCLFPAQNLWLNARRQFMWCCPKRKKAPASDQ